MDWTFADAVEAGVVADAAARAEVDLRGGDWPVRDQGTTGACVGFAAADGVLHWHYRQAGLLAEGERPSRVAGGPANPAPRPRGCARSGRPQPITARCPAWETLLRFPGMNEVIATVVGVGVALLAVLVPLLLALAAGIEAVGFHRRKCCPPHARSLTD